MARRQDKEGITSKEYTDARIDDLYARHKEDLDGIQAELDRRFDAFRHELDLRFEGIIDRLDRMNEIREAMRDQAARMVGLDLFSQRTESIDKHLQKIDTMQDRQRGRMAAYATISGIVLIVISILSLFLDHIVKF